MGEVPLVSIVISNFNGRENLKKCLSSLNRLRYPYKEVIAVDSGSSDGAPEMVEEKFPWVKLIRKEIIGIGEALNLGIAASKGDIIVFDLNNDDVVSENWLDPLVKILMTRPEAGVVCGKRYIGTTDRIDEAGGIFLLGISYGRGHGKKDSPKYNTIQEVDSAGVIATRREVIRKVGPLDEGYYIMGEDFDFCLRVRKMGYKILYVPSSVLYHQGSATIGKRTAAKLYYNARARILCLIKRYPLYKKIPLLVFHMTMLPFIVVTYYTYLSKGRFFDFLKAQLQAITDGLMRTRSKY